MYQGWVKEVPAVCLAVLIAANAGCHCCPALKQDCDGISCPQPTGYVNEDEKGKCKQRISALLDSLINQDGCNPEDERIPMLKRIGDKANLQSPNPVVKAAAEIKRDEDLCQQKIKAVKYLGKLGCSCYNKDSKVEEAMLVALNDCSPAVRMAAVQAIGGCVCDEPTGQTLCCTSKIADKLWDMAYKTDERGISDEPVEEIREWAAYVSLMCPKRAPVKVEGGEGPDDTEGEKTEPDMETPPKPMATSTEPGTSTASSAAQSQNPQEQSAPDDDALRNRLVVKMKSKDVDARLETVAFVTKAAQCGYPFLNEQPDDYGDTTLNTLKEIGFGLDQHGNSLESNFHVRQAAAEAVRFIDPASVTELEAGQLVVVKTEVIKPEPPTPAPLPHAAGNTSQPAVADTAATPPKPKPSVQAAQPPRQLAMVERPRPAKFTPPPKPVASRSSSNRRPASPITRPAVPVLPAGVLEGVVESVDVTNETARLRLSEEELPGGQAKVLVRHNYVLGRVQTIGEFQIVDAREGYATIRPVAGSSIRTVSTGDTALIMAQ